MPSPFGVIALGIVGMQLQAITFIGIVSEVAVELVTQDKLLVSVQLTMSPLFKLDDVKTELFVPAFIPLTFH